MDSVCAQSGVYVRVTSRCNQATSYIQVQQTGSTKNVKTMRRMWNLKERGGPLNLEHAKIIEPDVQKEPEAQSFPVFPVG